MYHKKEKFKWLSINYLLCWVGRRQLNGRINPGCKQKPNPNVPPSPLLRGDLRVGFALKCASENLKSGPEPYSRYKMNSKRSKYET